MSNTIGSATRKIQIELGKALSENNYEKFRDILASMGNDDEKINKIWNHMVEKQQNK